MLLNDSKVGIEQDVGLLFFAALCLTPRLSMLGSGGKTNERKNLSPSKCPARSVIQLVCRKVFLKAHYGRKKKKSTVKILVLVFVVLFFPPGLQIDVLSLAETVRSGDKKHFSFVCVHEIRGKPGVRVK